MAWSDAARRAAAEARRLHRKTPGIALSKAFKSDFTGKPLVHQTTQHKSVALTGAYSKTGKPGGELIMRSQGTFIMQGRGDRRWPGFMESKKRWPGVKGKKR